MLALMSGEKFLFQDLASGFKVFQFSLEEGRVSYSLFFCAVSIKLTLTEPQLHSSRGSRIVLKFAIKSKEKRGVSKCEN